MAVNQRELAKRIGRSLAAHRLERGLTQDKVAESLDVEPETISRFERGEVLPTLARLAELAQVYEVPLENLVRGASTRTLDQASDIANELKGLSSENADFVRHWVAEMCGKLRK